MMKKSTTDQLRKKEIELIVARLETLSPRVYFSSGGSNISRDDMIQHVKNNDAAGKEYLRTELTFLRALKNGKLLKHLFSVQAQNALVAA